MKTCTKCKQIKQLCDFRKDLNTKSLLSSWCKECHRIASRESRVKNPTIEYDKVWKRNNKDMVKAAKTRYISTLDPEEFKNKTAVRKLQYLYGISKEEYDAMLLVQNHSCKICKRHSSLFKKKLDVDHCHKTGKVRGLLCSSCNRGLGLFQDNVETLKAAINYLDQE